MPLREVDVEEGGSRRRRSLEDEVLAGVEGGRGG
jgi:hypothetical protein